ncbi:MAG: hypothetical protein PUB18_06025 [bacterium]|nr:hypothetical protein [bacterium]
MKEATGELNMTLITIIAVGAILGILWFLWPTIQDTIEETWNTASDQNRCPQGQTWVNGSCQ